MKTKGKKREPQTETFLVGEAPEAPAPVEQSNGNKAKDRFQLSFDLNEDGTPDFSAMRNSTKEKVRQFFSDPAMAAAFGAKPASPEVQMFNPQMVSGMYDMLGAIESVVAQRFGKIPPNIAKHVFTYTSAEKDALAGPTIRVLNKYIPDWMIKYQDEIALASTLIAITTAKVNAAITLMRMSQGQSVEMPKKEGDEPTGSTAPN